nr:CPBP family glutamic-type intramembrane protease [Candidatus Sigynarchaeota archaeon]
KTIEYKGNRHTISELSTQIFNQENQIQVLKLKQEQEATVSLNRLLFSKGQYLALVIVLCFIIPNFIFSSYHVFRSSYNLLDFWTSGMGFIYLGTGCWLTFVTLRFGWLPCILSHALINIISILLLGAAV